MNRALIASIAALGVIAAPAVAATNASKPTTSVSKPEKSAARAQKKVAKAAAKQQKLAAKSAAKGK